MNLRKVAIIGCGMVGSSTAFSLVESGLFTDMLLIDISRDRAVGEAMDLSHCLPFTRPVEIRAGDYRDISDCGIIIITAGVGQKPGETRMDCIQNNVKVFRSIIPQIIRYNTDAFILVVTNPVDVLTYVAHKLSELPSSQVFGSGTVLDSARLKFLVGRRLNVDPRSVHAFVIGEHGDSELAVWSSANVSGIALDEYCSHCGYVSHAHNRKKLADEVKNSAYEIIERKGATYYGIAAAVTRICECIVRDEHSIMSVSALVNGHYGLSDVYISVPSRIGSGGVEDIIDIPLSDEEAAALDSSAQTLKTALREIGF
ncbi:MAG: L-lactate dehydrogenase [Clostridiales bacterium]|nr:L-lactate dehydrogenase [Clostridiales bacterium]